MLIVSIAGIPYDTVDPFIIRDLPDVYVVGNQSALEVERRRIGSKEVVLVALPSFATSGKVCMINLNTLDVSPVAFDVESVEESCTVMEEEKEEEEVIINEDIANDEEQ